MAGRPEGVCSPARPSGLHDAVVWPHLRKCRRVSSRQIHLRRHL